MNSLTELTDIIKTLHHNITDFETDLLQRRIAQIEFQYSDKPAIIPLLKMMRSLVKYLDSKKGNAHPDSISVLLSITDQFKRIINSSEFDFDRDKDEINRIISGEIQKYKVLQSKISSKADIRGPELDNLKAVILAIDWEISDNTLHHFEKVVRVFLSAYQYNKIHHNFLKIIQSLGSYIGSRKSNAHPDAISFLRSVFDSFERVIQTPDMPLKDKKELLESNINRFHEFKARISKETPKTKSVSIISEEEFLPPALSHIKPISKISSVDVMPFTRLTETDDSEFKDINPPLSDKKNPPWSQRDVMGDLFSLKESPADELLDAIHLMDVHGSNQSQALHIQNQNIHSPSSGIKQFTPKLKNNNPIPEIEDRLDEFFNLETSPKESARQSLSPDRTVKRISEPEEENTEGLIPFQFEDESFEPGNAEPHGKKQEDKLVLNILDRLKISIETIDRLKPESVLISIKKDITALKTVWHNDPEKTLLLDLLLFTLQFLENPKNSLLGVESAITNHQKDDPAPGRAKDRPPGVFARIKAMFTSKQSD